MSPRVSGHPRRRALLVHGISLLALAAISVFLGSPLAPGAAPTYAEVLANPVEQALLDLTNVERGRSGLASVEFDPALLEIARARAAAQLGVGALSHSDANGTLGLASLLAGSDLEYQLAGENLARLVSIDDAALERVERVWMGSATHRKNILEPSFNRLAVGVAPDPSSGRVVIAQIFRAVP